MKKELLRCLTKPELYTKSTEKFWDDEHISKGMLQAHLDPGLEAASRKHAFMDSSVEWISNIAPPEQYPLLLDLGCGPGLYAQRFFMKGYQVTGIDFSFRSVDYARNAAAIAGNKINYLYQDYLTISYQEEFDVITLIYRDFSVLSDRDRKQLLSGIYRALKPGGRFIVDVTTPRLYENKEEDRTWCYQDCGFWCEKPHLVLEAFYRYDEFNTFLKHYVIVTDTQVKNYYIWDHAFLKDELENNLAECGLRSIDYYNDVAGAAFTSDGVCMCAVAMKPLIS